MKRRIPYFISALMLTGLMAVVLRSIDTSTSTKRFLSAFLPERSEPAAPAIPSLRPTRSSPSETISDPVATAGEAPAPQPRLKAVTVPEVRVRATRNGRDYGWVQLPRGTRVELIRDEGKTLVIRFDQVTLRIPRVQAETGMVVPVIRGSRVAGL